MTKRFNAILDAHPEKIFPGVVDKTDFKQVLKFFRLLDDDELGEPEKFAWMCKIFFNTVPSDPQAAVNAVAAFISGQDGGADEDGGSAKKVFCYNQDAGRLYAAFLQAYRIDLRTERMHWWVFLELFQALPDDTRLMQVIELRGRKSDKSDSKEAKAALRKAQRAVALDKTGDTTAALDNFFDAWGKQNG